MTLPKRKSTALSTNDSNQVVSGPGIGAKEREFQEQQEAIQLEEVRKELEIAPEVKEAGVEVKSEEMELPPPVAKMGVTSIGGEQPVSPPTTNLPITDDKIATGLGASVWASICWLANWCLRQLKKAHVKLKKVQGKIIRVVTK